jgi:alpha-galactosidase
LIVATDVRALTPIMKEVLFNKEIIDVNQDPLGVAGDRVGTYACTIGSQYCQVMMSQQLLVGYDREPK